MERAPDRECGGKGAGGAAVAACGPAAPGRVWKAVCRDIQVERSLYKRLCG
jgi:hypothetical protein